jgi:hypothetical protein
MEMPGEESNMISESAGVQHAVICQHAQRIATVARVVEEAEDSAADRGAQSAPHELLAPLSGIVSRAA